MKSTSAKRPYNNLNGFWASNQGWAPNDVIVQKILRLGRVVVFNRRGMAHFGMNGLLSTVTSTAISAVSKIQFQKSYKTQSSSNPHIQANPPMTGGTPICLMAIIGGYPNTQ